MTDLELNKAALLYVKAQLSAKALAARFGVSANTVVRRLRARGIPIRDKVAQRYSDKALGRYDHGEAVRAAFAAGRYDTDAYRNRKGGFAPGVDRRGEKNPFFGQTHSPVTRERLSRAARTRVIAGQGDYGPEWTEELRQTVLRRDGYRCRRCGSGEGMLQVHHVDTDRTHNDLMNLLTLCAACHLAFHGRREGVEEVLAAAAALAQRDGSAPDAAHAEGGDSPSGP